MKHTLLLFCLAFFLTAASGQVFTLQPPPTFNWVKTITFANLNTNAEFFDFYTDPTGNSYVYGWVQGGLSFGPGVSLQTLNAYEGHFVAKYAPNGVLLWVRKIVAPNGGAIFEDYRIGGITADPAGNVYITSQITNPALDFGNGVLLNRKCTSNCSDFFIAKYNSDGIAQWVVNGTGNAGTYQSAGRMVTAADGSLFVGGDYNGPTIQLGNTVFSNLSEKGIYLAHFSNEGNLLNANFYNNGNGYAQLEHLAITSQNKLLATGYYDVCALDFGNGVTLPTSGNTLTTNYYVVEFNQQGQALWARNLNSESNNLNVFDIVADTFGYPYIIVDFEANLSSGPDEIAPPATSGLHDAVLLHVIDSTFYPVVEIHYSGAAYPLANIAIDRNNRFFVGGGFTDPQVQIGDVSLDNTEFSCDDALFLSGISDSLSWVRSAGGGGCEAILTQFFGRALSTDDAGNLYSVGSFGLSINLDNFSRDGDGLFITKLGTALVGTKDPGAIAGELQVFPNPGAGDFSVAIPDFSGPTNFTLYDARGRVCYQRLAAQAGDLDFHLQLPPGMYTLQGISGHKIGQQKVFITR